MNNCNGITQHSTGLLNGLASIFLTGWVIWYSGGFVQADEPAPLQLAVECSDTYAVHEPIMLLVTLTNTSKEPLKAFDLDGGWAGVLFLDFKFTGPIGGKNLNYAAGVTSRRGHVGSAPRGITLEPGAKTVGEFNLTKYSRLIEPGAYTLHAVLNLQDGDGNIHSVSSEPVVFKLARSANPADEKILDECLSYKGRRMDSIMYGSNSAYYFKTMGMEENYLRVINDAQFNDAVLTKYLTYYLATYFVKANRFGDASNIIGKVLTAPPFAHSDDGLLVAAQASIGLGEKPQALGLLNDLLKNYPHGNCAKRAAALKADWSE